MAARLFKVALSVLLLTGLFSSDLFAFQESDSLKNDHQIHLISGALFSTGDEAPFWIRANNSQRISDAPNSAWQRILFQKKLSKNKKLDWGYGLDVIGRLGEGFSGDFTQAYIEGKNKYFNFFIGRKEERLGVVDSTLSIGPLVNGNNALPIPKVAIRTNGWLNVPFTKGLFKFNGYYSHGWFEEDRFVQNALLHQKYFYLKLGKKNWPVEAYWGIISNAQWSGRRSDNGKREPSTFSDYLKVITGRRGGASASQSDQENALGNNLGNSEVGTIVKFDKVQVVFYWHVLYEDGSGLSLLNWRDGLMGFSLKRSKGNSWFQGVNIEIVRTTDQNQFKFLDNGTILIEPDNFFNNGQYRSGWTYRNQVIGSPVFLLKEASNLNSRTRISNLVNGVNFAVEGGMKKWDYSLSYIYLKNQGTHFERFEEAFKLHTVLIRGAYQISAKSKLDFWLNLDSSNQRSSIGIGLEYHRNVF